MRILFTLVLTALLAALAGCEEKPSQQLVQSEERAQQRDQQSTEDARRQRTLGQGESDRIHNQGTLR
jgi:predicted small lipoprotein YifL